MKLIKDKNVVTILAGLICVVIIAVAYRARVSKIINLVKIPVATRDIAAREQIKDTDIEEIEVAAAAISNNIIRFKDQLVGGETKKYVNFNTKIPKGSFFYTTAVVEWATMPDSAWSEISDDNTIVSLPVNSVSTFGNSIFPNDVIDIYYHTQDGDLLVYGKLIEAIKVLAVKDQNGYHIGQRSASQESAGALIFSVPEDLHLLLRKAMALDASGQSLVPVPRNRAYSEEGHATNISSEYLRSLINQQCYDPPLDEVETSKTEPINIVQ